MKHAWSKGLRSMSAAALIMGLSAGSLGGAAAADTVRPAAAAAGQPGADAAAAVPAVPAPPGAPGAPVIFKFHGGAGELFSPVHQRHYWKLLASTYAPDTVEAWTQALEERRELEARLPKAGTVNKIIIKKKPTADAEPEVEAESAVEVQQDGTVQKKVRIFRHSAEAERRAAPGAALHDVLTLRLQGDGPDDTIKSEPTPEEQRSQELTAAVEADDAEAIRRLLPQLLEDYRKQTEQLKVSLEQHLAEDKGASGPVNP